MGQINVNPQKIMRTFGVKPGTLCLVTVISRGDKFRLGRPQNGANRWKIAPIDTCLVLRYCNRTSVDARLLFIALDW